jgi:hypothetical protein
MGVPILDAVAISSLYDIQGVVVGGLFSMWPMSDRLGLGRVSF